LRAAPTRVPLIGEDGHVTDFAFTFFSLTAAPAVDPVPTGALPIWHVVAAAGQFSEAPSVESAAAFVAVVIDHDMHEEAKKVALPWLLDALLRPAEKFSLSDVREHLLRGEFGTVEAWRTRQENWTTGLSVSELVAAHQASAGPCEIRLTLPRFLGRRLLRGREHAPARDVLRSAALQLPDSAAVAIGLMYCSDRHNEQMPVESVNWLQRYDDPSQYPGASCLIAARTLASLVASDPSLAWARMALVRFGEAVGRINLSAASFDQFLSAAKSDETLRQFLPLIATSGRARFRAVRQPERESQVGALMNGLTVQPTDNESISGAIALFQLLAQCDVDNAAAIDQLLRWSAAPIAMLLTELERAPTRNDRLIADIARKVFTSGQWRVVPRAYRSLLQVSEAKPSGLDSNELADSLELPRVLGPTNSQSGGADAA
jgi:hypothetical protein